MKEIARLFPKQVQAFVRSCVRAALPARGFARDFNFGKERQEMPAVAPMDSPNPLTAYFQSHHSGHGIWKWDHYLPIYHRHFQKFVGTPCRILEVGIFSGGSLEMWRRYFGEACRIVGVDIEESCRAYESDSVGVYIGNQGDPEFWKALKAREAAFDLILDDGSHRFPDQAVTLEQMLGHLRPGGVYLCEDVHGEYNRLIDYLMGLVANLNAWEPKIPTGPPGRALESAATPFQSSIYSICFYPYVVVIERTDAAVDGFSSTRMGTKWQPFL